VLDASLVPAVEQFARVTVGWSDADLDRPWAWREYDEGVRVAFLRTAEQLRELAADLAAERAGRGPRRTTAQRVLAQYHAAYRDLAARLLGLSDDVGGQVRAPEEWPVQRAVTHVLSTERQFFARIRDAVDRRRAGDERPPAMSGEAVDAFLGEDLRVERIRSLPLSGVLAAYDRLHDRVLADLADVTDAELATPSAWWEDSPYPVRFRLHRFDSHLRQHTIHVEKILAALGRASTEAKRLLQVVYNALGEAEGNLIGAPNVGVDQRRELAATITARASELAGMV
jgi:hypothetical protein